MYGEEMIYYDSKEQVFYLETVKTTYAFCVFKGKALVHLYWGEKIPRNLKNDYCKKFWRKSLTGWDLEGYSTDCMPLEFSTYGSADLRMPTFKAEYSDGSTVSKFDFCDYEIKDGKEKLSGLPATYSEDGDKVQTLVIHLKDALKDTDVYLSYSVFEELDAITRNVKIVNNGEKFVLDTALSASLDFYGFGGSDIITLDGAWCKERCVNRRRIVHGNQNVESRVGASSAFHNPFVAVCSKDTTENSGDAYGFNLVYSGNFTAGVEVDAYNDSRVYIGINPFGFKYVLENGDSFQTPEAVLVYSPEGLSGMSRIYHKLYTLQSEANKKIVIGE